MLHTSSNDFIGGLEPWLAESEIAGYGSKNTFANEYAIFIIKHVFSLLHGHRRPIAYNNIWKRCETAF